MKNGLCKYCVNKSECEKCDEHWNDMFIPSDDVKSYFEYSYNGIHGIRGYTYDFNTTNEALKPTHAIMIGNDYYCPYCGEQMWPIQDKKTLIVTGYCCICEGAQAEISYEEEKKALEKEYAEKQHALEAKYAKSLSFVTDKLLEIKQRKEKSNMEFFKSRYTHFSTLNGEPYMKIEQLL